MSFVVLDGIDASAQLVTHVLDPVSAQDAATKAYVDGNTVPPTLGQAGENLTAKDLVNWDTAGHVRRADASVVGKEAQGFVLASFLSGATATVYSTGVVTGLSGLTPGVQFLSTSPGQVASTAPGSSHNVVQRVGTAPSATSLIFRPELSIELA